MEKTMRDLEKIREDYEFHLDSKQIRLAVLGGVAVCVLVFALGFLVGRQFPPPSASLKFASSALSRWTDREPGDEAVGPHAGVEFEFFEELSGGEPGAKLSDRSVEQDLPTANETPPPALADVTSKPAVSTDEPAPDDGGPEEIHAAGLTQSQAPGAPKTVPTKYTVQVGAFEDKEGAESLVQELKHKRYPSYTFVKTITGKGTWHRVRVGQYASRAEAEKVAELLEDREGLSTFITLYAR